MTHLSQRKWVNLVMLKVEEGGKELGVGEGTEEGG